MPMDFVNNPTVGQIVTFPNGQSYRWNGGQWDLLLAPQAGPIAFPAVQVSNSDPNTLDDYAEGTWTPNLLFGGAAVGMTYSSRIGIYTKIGRLVTLIFDFTLSAKGSSTGPATVTGVPITVAATATGSVVITYWVLAAAPGGHPLGYINNAGITLNYGGGIAGPAGMTDALFGANSRIVAVATYFAPT